MPVRITCPGCGSSIAVQPADQGRTIRCVVCRTFVAVPVIEQADVAPPMPRTPSTPSACVAPLPTRQAPPAKKRSVWRMLGLVAIVLAAAGVIAFVVHRGAGEGASGAQDASE